MSLARPSSRTTRARPRPFRTTTRSPGRMSPLPFRSMGTGTFGTKNGSPTNCLPRLSTSTTWRSFRPSDSEEAADGQAGAGRTEQQAGRDQDHRIQREREGIDVAPGVERPRVQERRQRDLLAQDEEDDRSYRPGRPADEPFEHERTAHEPVRRADELHHLDLAPAREDRQPDRVRDQQGRSE